MNKQEFLTTALDFVHNAKVSVLPVGKDKRPLVEWKEYQTRFPTNEEIKRWAEFPDVQLGIVTGAISNLTVVDVEKGGDGSFLPQNTTIVETGGGGAHFYYQYCKDVRNKARIKELIDIRSEGGYVVAPGSVSSKGAYTLVLKCPTPALPVFPLHLFNGGEKPAPTSALLEFAKSQTEVQPYDGHGLGQRNEGMTRYIGHVLTRVHPSKWDTEAWSIICQANLKNTPPLPERELRTSFNSIKQTEVNNNPRRWSNDREIFESKTAQQKKEWEQGEEIGDGRILLMSEVAKLQHITVDKVYPLGFELFDKEIMGGAIPGDVISIAGMSGEGKTTLAMNLAKNFVHKNDGSVLFFSYEMLVQFVWEKFKTMGMKEEDAMYCPFKNITGNVEWIEKKIQEAKLKHDVKFVVIDHLGFLAPKLKGMSSKSIENYSVYITGIMRELKTVAKNEEIIIILPVHMRKREAFFKKNADLDINDIAHSAGVAQESDLVFLVQREKDTRVGAPDVYSGYSTISLAKNRRGSKNPKGFFTLINESFAQDEMYGGIDTQGAANTPKRGYTGPSGASIAEAMAKGMSKEAILRDKVDKRAGLFEEPSHASDGVF